jgi:hypothetical protein
MKLSPASTRACLIACLLAACGGDDGREETSDSMPTSATNTTLTAGGTGTGTTAPTGETGVDDTAAPTSTGPGPVSATSSTADDTTLPDPTTGPVTTGDDTTAPGESTFAETTTGGFDACKRVDFLFVVDNSVSMEGEQAALNAAFPMFLDTIQSTLPASDYHIMVADTDEAGRCAPGMCSHSTCQADDQYACQDIFSACDTTRGAGVVHPAGEFASNKPCPFPGGARWLASGDPALVDNFTCAATVGTAGNASERPMDGMVAAVSPALLAPGGCNEGFLRDDAILVVTFISDDPNVEDENTAQQTHDAMVAAKGGDADKIVMLGLIPGEQGCGNGGQHWADMIALFGERGIQGSVCSPEFDTFFQSAIDTILDTCVINPG